MRAASLITVAAVAALGLAGCNKGESGGTGSRICTPFPEAANSNANANANANAPGAIAAAPAADPAAALDDCLHRWGYTLAASAADRAQDVAQATVAACTPALTRWNQTGLATVQGGPSPENGVGAAPSLLTGQPTTPMAEHYTYAQGRALFYVVQARAGKCAPPPATATTAQR